MTDGDALLRAVLENPDDDTPRLVYADWLQEHGQESRAEFIRVQIQIAQRGEPEVIRSLFVRERACRPKGLPEWADDATWGRGFIAKLRISTPSLFLQHAAEILAAHPVERIIFNGFRVEITPPGAGHAWQIYYYLPEEEWVYFALSSPLETRAAMVVRLSQDLRDLEAEFN